jgi:7-cyano-7-deazaguanine synthase in queuosine biosynthesis
MNRTSPASPSTDSSSLAALAIGVSGGLDSTAAYYFAQRKFATPADAIRCVFFDLGQPYADKERRALQGTGIPFEEVSLPLVTFQGSRPTPEAQIIPARNLVIASWLGAVAHTAWVVGTANDMAGHTPDKCPAFYQTASRAITQATGRFVTVATPFASWSKQKIIQWAIREGLDVEIGNTVSCYHPTLWRCGACKVCVERYLSFWLAGHETGRQYDEFPPASAACRALRERYRAALAEYDFSRYPRERVRLHLRALERIERGEPPPRIDWLAYNPALPEGWEL